MSAETVSELRARLRRPLEQERQRGYQDDAVVGGVEKLVRTLGKPFKDVQAVLVGYAELDEDARATCIAEALDLLGGDVNDEDDASTLPSRPVTTPAATSTPVSASPTVNHKVNPNDILDVPLKDALIPLAAQAPKKLAAIGIETYRDLLYTFPRRYEDRRALPFFGALEAQENATAIGQVTGRKGMKSKRGMHILRVFLEDAHGGKLTAVWFNQPWLEKQLFPGQTILVTGKVKRTGRKLEINVSDFEVNDAGDSLSFDRIVPVYTTTQGLSQSYVRKAIYTMLSHCGTFADYLPKKVLERYHLEPLDTALRDIHFPADSEPLKKALRRLKFDEFLFLELRMLLNRDTTLLGKHFQVKKLELDAFKASLPFAMTGAQKRVLEEILADMAKPKQMAQVITRGRWFRQNSRGGGVCVCGNL